MLFAGNLEKPIIPLLTEEFDTSGTVPFISKISSFESR